MNSNKRKVGGWYEKIAADYLKSHGLHIKAMNYRCKLGEIDIVARDGDYLVFIEVKYRIDNKKGDAEEAVGYWKKKTISKIAKYYLMLHYNTTEIACRFDVIAINGNNIRWVKNAFEYTE